MNARDLVVIFLAVGAGAAYALTRRAPLGPVDRAGLDALPWALADLGDDLVNGLASTAKASDGLIAGDWGPPAPPPLDLAEANQAAFLAAIRAAEGTDRAADPYRVVFGYGTTLQDLSDHPYFTGEWQGAAFGDGNWSTAAGAYQFIRGTWSHLRDRMGLPDFGPASQDAAALQLIADKGALDDVRAGRFADAVQKVRKVWASLPGAGYGQGERSLAWLQARYQQAGGSIA